MTTNETAEVERIDLEPRTERALTEYLTVLEDVGRVRDAEDLYLVVSESGSEYLVDPRTGTCECPDAEYRDLDCGCKHLRRVAFATGQDPIPADVPDIDPQIGEHTAGTARVAVADGGAVQAVDEEPDTEKREGRPEDCDCSGSRLEREGGLPCWPCYRDGFETPNLGLKE